MFGKNFDCNVNISIFVLFYKVNITKNLKLYD